MEQTKTILKKTWVVAALACVCCLLWGSAIPLIKTGYRLMQAGVRTTAVRYNGTIHDFMMLDALAGTEPAKAATAQVCGVLKQALFG